MSGKLPRNIDLLTPEEFVNQARALIAKRDKELSQLPSDDDMKRHLVKVKYQREYVNLLSRLDD